MSKNRARLSLDSFATRRHLTFGPCSLPLMVSTHPVLMGALRVMIAALFFTLFGYTHFFSPMHGISLCSICMCQSRIMPAAFHITPMASYPHVHDIFTICLVDVPRFLVPRHVMLHLIVLSVHLDSSSCHVAQFSSAFLCHITAFVVCICISVLDISVPRP